MLFFCEYTDKEDIKKTITLSFQSFKNLCKSIYWKSFPFFWCSIDRQILDCTFVRIVERFWVILERLSVFWAGTASAMLLHFG
jgi:hypothetical protein